MRSEATAPSPSAVGCAVRWVVRWAGSRRTPPLRAALGALVPLCLGCVLTGVTPAASPERASDLGSTPAAPPSSPIFPTPFHVIAHRGASAQAPENTLPAFERARDSGAFEVELDVMLSADDVLVLFHDATLDEKTNLTGRVRDHSAAELLRADIGSWFDEAHPRVEPRYAGTPLVTLSDLFRRFGRELFYHVEIKATEAAIPRLVLARLADFALQDRAILTSFYFEQLARARELDGEIPIALLVVPEAELPGVAIPDGKPPRGTLLDLQKRWIDAAHEARFQMVAFISVDLSPELVAYARERALEIRAWGIRSDEDMDRAIALGCNGMTTNWPERLIARLVAHMGAGGGSP